MKKAVKISQMRDIVRYWKKQDVTIALVPTLGKVREEHIELIKKALKENDRVVVSMFVNPLQFSSEEAYENHETAFEEGEELCRQLGVHQLFQPDRSEMYAGRFCTYINCEEWPDQPDSQEEFQYYRGVCTVVVKLFHIIQPDRIYIRKEKEKDAVIFRHLAEDLNMNVDVCTE